MFLLNSALQSLLIQWIINIFLINIIAIYTCTGILASFFHWPMTFMLFILYLVLHYHGTLLFSQILNLFICGILDATFSQQTRRSITFDFQSPTTSAETKFLLPKPIRMKDRALPGVCLVMVRYILTQT